jgi:hypothetical protein
VVTGRDGIVDFGWATCTLEATADTLTLHAEADGEENLRRVQDLLTGHVTRFGRRDDLAVSWHPSEMDTTPPGTGTKPRHKRRGTVVLIAAGLVAIAVHLGLGGTLLAGSSWPGVAADVVLAVIVAKVILMSWVTYRRFSGNRVR